MRPLSTALIAILTVGCGSKDEPEKAPAPPPPSKPARGAVGDHDLRVMLAEIASSKACEMMRGSFQGLRADDRPELTTGVLWIRECKITNDGTRLTMQLGGQGWQWAEKKQKKAGAEFEVREYIKFDVDARIEGTLDIAYDRNDHIVSLWFSPTKTPDIKFKPIGDIDVDEKGLWSSVLGGISSVFLQSPEQQSKDKAEQEGEHTFANQLVRGMTLAMDLCTGYQRFTIGRPQKGELGPPNPGESRRMPVEVQPGGLFISGPYEAPNGMNIDVKTDGPIRVGLACNDAVDTAAAAFIAEQTSPLTKTLDQADITTTGKLSIKGQRCKVAVMVRSLAQHEVTFEWKRPARETARSTGGPAIQCAPRSRAARRP